jgi:hypothetical protein
MNVEQLLSLVRACIFQDEPTFLEDFHNAVEAVVFCAGWCCKSCCDAAARESLAKNGLCMRVWMTTFGASGRLIKEMADFLHRSGNTGRELGFDEIKKATAPEYMEAYISSQALSK